MKHFELNLLVKKYCSGFVGTAFCVDSRDDGSDGDPVQEDADRGVSGDQKGIGGVGRFGARVLHKPREPPRVEELLHGFRLRSARRYGNRGGDRETPHQTRRLERSQRDHLGRARPVGDPEKENGS